MMMKPSSRRTSKDLERQRIGVSRTVIWLPRISHLPSIPPTHEQIANKAKKKEYARESRRISAFEDTTQALFDVGLVGRRRRNKQRFSIEKDLKMVVMQTTRNGILLVHKEIYVMVVETFGNIR
jgi:hypothetical protein